MRRSMLETMFRHAGAVTAEGRTGSVTDAELFRAYLSDGYEGGGGVWAFGS
jgi:hypothetical protein